MSTESTEFSPCIGVTEGRLPKGPGQRKPSDPLSCPTQASESQLWFFKGGHWSGVYTLNFLCDGGGEAPFPHHPNKGDEQCSSGVCFGWPNLQEAPRVMRPTIIIATDPLTDAMLVVYKRGNRVQGVGGLQTKCKVYTTWIWRPGDPIGQGPQASILRACDQLA